MTYFISTKIRGITYYVRVKKIDAYLPDSQFAFEGLKNNASEFTREEAVTAMAKLKTDFELELTPKTK